MALALPLVHLGSCHLEFIYSLTHSFRNLFHVRIHIVLTSCRTLECTELLSQVRLPEGQL